jgi:hypothetical protein
MPTKERTLAKARADLGIHESPDGSNRTAIGSWFGWNGVAWCAMSVSKWLITSGFPIRKNAGAHELAAYLTDQPGWKKVAPASVRSGDVVLFTWSHIGICEARANARSVVTIEGNQNNGVHRVARANSSIAYGVRPPYTSLAPDSDPAPSPAIAGRKAKVVTADKLWNSTLGTERHPAPGHNGVVTLYMRDKRFRNGNLYVPITWGGNKTGGWYRYDHLRFV